MNQFIMPSIPDQKVIAKEGASLIDRAASFRIKDEDDFVASWTIIEQHDQAMKRVAEKFDPFVSGLHKLHKMAVELRDGFLKPLLVSKAGLLSARSGYRQERERLQKIEDDKKAAEIQAAQKRELEREAKKIEKTGDVETAAAIREEAKTLPVPVLAPTVAVPKMEGSVLKTRWMFAIEEPDKVEREYCDPNQSKIRKVVDALGDKAKISGIRIWKETKEHSRAV